MSSKPFLDLPFHPNKIEVFFSAVPDEMKAQILGILQFREGSLPVRYSVLPLIPGKLSFNVCQPLLDKVMGRINSCSSKKLSFAGRFATSPFCFVQYSDVLVQQFYTTQEGY
jgi:hypothetical protein